jgi:hypothetical protein
MAPSLRSRRTTHRPAPHGAGRRAWVRLGALLAVAAFTGAGVTEPAAAPALAVATSPPTWAAAAEARIDAELAAAHRGVADLVALYASEVEVDARPWSGRILAGRDAVRGDLQARFGPTVEELAAVDVALDAAGAAVRQRLTVDPRFAGPAELMELRSYGPQGVRHVRVLVALSTLQRSPVAPSPGAFAELNANIGRELANWPEHTLARSPEGDDELYLDHRVPAAVRTVALVLQPRRRTTCPGRLTLVLALDGDGGVEQQRRFDAPDDVRRCEPDRDGGWWDHLDPGTGPAAPAIDVDGLEVHGAGPASAELVRWALGRFTAAGLPRPTAASVTFATGTSRCLGIAGTVTAGPDGPEVLLCFDDAEICADTGCTSFRLAPRMTVLHELAHVWEAEHLDAAARDRYLARTGLSTWLGADAAWEQRGGERSAEVLMWGLLDRDIPLVRLAEPSFGQLVTEFRALTGRDPLVAPRAVG